MMVGGADESGWTLKKLRPKGIVEQSEDAAASAKALLGLQEQRRERLGKQGSANSVRLVGMLLV